MEVKLLSSRERNILLIIAYISMLIDHIGYVLLPLYHTIPNAITYYTICRCLGRFAFPIFCYFLTDGFFATKNKLKYLGLLALFAIISEIPYDLAMNQKIFTIAKQNVMFELLLGFIFICIADRVLFRKDIKWYNILFYILLAIVYGYIAHALRFDYGFFGIISIAAMYLAKKIGKVNNYTIMLLGILPLFFVGIIEGVALLLVILLYFMKPGIGKSHSKLDKILRYAFYPAHLLLLYLILILAI